MSEDLEKILGKLKRQMGLNPARNVKGIKKGFCKQTGD